MIKDQCNNCKKNGTVDCGQTIVFNSLPCEHYVKRLNLTKSNDQSVSPVTSPPSQPASQPVPQPSASPNNNVSNATLYDISFWKSLFSFSGRIRRTQYWLTILCINLLFLPANISGDNMSEGVAIYTLLLCIPALWISLANIVKRCHDLGKSGLFVFLLLIPFVNLFIAIYIGFFQGDLNDNDYGPSPY